MRLAARLRFVGAWWLLPAMLAASLVAASQLAVPAFSQPVSAAARVSESAPFVDGFAGAAAAVAAARLRVSGRLGRPHRRSLLLVVAEPILAIVAVGVFVSCAAILWVQSRAGIVGWPGWGVLLVTVSVLVAVVAWGVALGRWFRAWLAAPFALVGTYLVLGLPAAMQPLWVRHLFGVAGACCAVDASLSTRVVGAATIVAAGATAAALILTLSGPAGQPWPMPVWAAVPVAALILGAGFGSGVLLVKDLGSDPVSARAGSADCQRLEGSSATVCVWPEHQSLVAEYTPLLQAVAATELAHGLPPTRLFSESRDGLDRHGTYIVLARHANMEDQLLDMAATMSVNPAQCRPVGAPASDLTQNDYLAAAALERWWATHLADQLHVTLDESRLPPEPDLLASLSPSSLSTWLQEATAARRSCQPSTLPAS
jgi:hypothetical protein